MTRLPVKFPLRLVHLAAAPLPSTVDRRPGRSVSSIEAALVFVWCIELVQWAYALLASWHIASSLCEHAAVTSATHAAARSTCLHEAMPQIAYCSASLCRRSEQRCCFGQVGPRSVAALYRLLRHAHPTQRAKKYTKFLLDTPLHLPAGVGGREGPNSVPCPPSAQSRKGRRAVPVKAPTLL